MPDNRFARLAASLPPGQWGQFKKKLEVLERFARIGRPTTEDVVSHARELGMTRESFYRLVRTMAEKQSAASRPLTRPTSPRRRSGEVYDVIMDAIAAADPAAGTSQIHRDVIERCDRIGLEPPSITAIATRVDEEPLTPRLSERLPRSADLVIDAAPLFATTGSDAPLIVVSAVISVADGIVVRHHVGEGRPYPDLHLDLLERAALGFPRADHRPLKVLRTAGASALPAVVQRPGKGAIDVVQSTVGLDAGAAIRSVFGRNIGRVRVLAAKPGTWDERAPVVLFEDMVAVVDQHVERRNDLTREVIAAAA